MTTDPKQLSRTVEILKAVAHPVRLRLIKRLCQGDASVTSLAEVLGISQAIVSQQLRILRMNRLVEVQRQSGFSIYSLAEPHLRDLVRCVDRCCGVEA